MTAEPSLYDLIGDVITEDVEGLHGESWDKIKAICDDYEASKNELFSATFEACCGLQKRIAELEASNRNMASRLKKLMEKKK